MNENLMQPAGVHSFGLIPMPRTIESGSGVFLLQAETPFTINDASLRGVVSGFSEFLSQATSFSSPIMQVDAPRSGAVNFVLLSAGNVPSEGYELVVSPDAVLVRVSDPAGAFYATQTLRQLLPAVIERREPQARTSWPIPALRVKDSPEYAYRGMHLDVSRHFFSVAAVKRYIDLIAAHKMNFFHWHLTDDQGWRIEIPQYPLLTEVGAWRAETVQGHALSRDARMDGEVHGGFYTQDDIREVVAYASARFVTVVPEIDLPGHASALLAAYPEFACEQKDYRVQTSFGIFKNVLCPHERTFRFLEDVIGDVATLFPGPYIHIGGDEVITSQWENCSSCAELMRAKELGSYKNIQGYFAGRLDEIVRGLNKKTIVWDDALDAGSTSDVTVMAWRGDDKVIGALERGHSVIVTSTKAYFDFYQSSSLTEPLAIHGLTELQDVYQLSLEPEGLTDAAARGILGGQGNLWSEYVATEDKLQYMAVPRMSALAEVLWSSKDSRSWTNFLRRLRQFFVRLDYMGINASRSVYAIQVHTVPVEEHGTLQIELTVNGRDHQIRYTLDGSAPDSDSPLYVGPIVLDRATTIRAAAEDLDDGGLFGDTRMTFHPHKALNSDMTFENAPDASWGQSRQNLLADGIIRTDQIFRHDEWAGFSDGRMIAILDMSAQTEVSEVTIGFDSAQHKRLHPPSDIEILVSADRVAWQSVALQGAEEIELDQRNTTLNFAAISARYVKLVVSSNRKYYSAELDEYVSAPLYIDEIVVH